MLHKWLTYQTRVSSPYVFPVIDAIEVVNANGETIEYLAKQILLAHGNPQVIIDDCRKLLTDVIEDMDALAIIKSYLDKYILPSTDKGIVEIGNFGETLAARLLVEFEQFWFPIYKIRYREKKNWAMRLTDFCVIKEQDTSRPLVCYIEVKTKSSKRDLDLALDGHESLRKSLEGEGNLSNGEILHFMQDKLTDKGMLREASFVGDIKLEKITYDVRHDLFLVHDKKTWVDEILKRLEASTVDPRLLDFSIKVVLIDQLRKIIDTTYDCCAVSALDMLKEMDKQEYLRNIYGNLETLASDQWFQSELAQVRSRSIQAELLPNKPLTHFTFNAQKIWKRCDYLFSESARILRENHENGIAAQEFSQRTKKSFDWIKTAAQSFEYLAKVTDDDEKEMLLLSAAICYHVAGYHANAQCIAKMIETLYSSDIQLMEQKTSEERLIAYFRRALVNFLKRDIAQLTKMIQVTLPFVSDLLTKVTSGLADGTSSLTDVFYLSAHASFQQAISAFVHYSMSGDVEQLVEAQDSLQRSYSCFQQVGDARLGVLVSELRTIFGLIEIQGTWSNIRKYTTHLLENNIWRTYLRNLAFEKSIVEFWPSQLKALDSGLLTTEDSLIIQMPTSAGKTFIAELALLTVLTQQKQKRCLYIAPYRALVNEVVDKLTETLGSVGYRVSNLAGGFEFDVFQNFLLKESHVLVATPEKMELLFRTHPDYFEQIAIVVIDEGHILDEGIATEGELPANKTLVDEIKRNGTLGRGTLLDLLITRLKHKLPQARFLLLSAVMPDINMGDFVTWLSEKKQEPIKIDRSERPSRQVIATFEWLPRLQDKSNPNGQLEYVSLPTLPDGRKPFVPDFLQRAKYVTGEQTPSTGKAQQKIWPISINNKTQSTALLAVRFATSGPVLVFCALPKETKEVMGNVITALKYSAASSLLLNESLRYTDTPALESFDLAVEWLGNDHPLTRGLHYGVGLHYGSLPDPVRQAVEDDFRSGKIKILVSTNTLGQGVNMPVKTAIIYSLERVYFDKESNTRVSQFIKKRDFWNICGRAGRAGKETEGQIVFVISTPRDRWIFNQFNDEENLEEVESALYKLLLALIEKRISQDDLIGYLDAHILALLAEEVVDTADEIAIREFLGTSLAGVQALRHGIDLAPLVSVIQQTSLWINQQIPEKRVQKIFASTGLSVASCQMLEKGVNAFLEKYSFSDLESAKGLFTVDNRLLEAAFRTCQNILEMNLKDTARYEGPEDEFDLIKDWVAGKSVNEIRDVHWSQGQSDNFGNYVAERLIYKLPWGLNGFLCILASKLQQEITDLPISWQCIASMMKFGVNSPVACWICSFVISSRRLAYNLAAYYPIDNATSITGFIKWIVNLSTDFIFQELECSIAEKQRLLHRINQMVTDDNQIQFILRRIVPMESEVKGIPYDNRAVAALEVSIGDQLVLEREQDNPKDFNAVLVMFQGTHIGYVQRDIAKIISREMLIGREFQAYARIVKPPTKAYPFPYIDIRIEAK